MAARKDKREDLLKFVDKNAFDPILKGFAKLSDKDMKKLEDIQPRFCSRKIKLKD
jgi:hypothetical protein